MLDVDTTAARSAEEQIAELKTALAAAVAERDRLREAYQRIKLELELLKRRLFVAKAERIDTAQLELELGDKLAELDAVAQRLAEDAAAGSATDTPPTSNPKKRKKPTGRRDLRQIELPEESIEITDPAFEGKADRIDWEESSKIGWRRPTPVRVIIRRAKYRLDDPTGPATTSAPPPPELIRRCLVLPSMLAHIACDKFCDGLPLFRQEDRFARGGFPLDRGTMCRWLEDLGMTVGATIVAAMRKEALARAFCIATDATGILVQPIKDKQVRQPAKRGHFLVQIADRDHVFFEYMPRETSAAIGELFHGFSGYVLADAKSVYDLLYRPPDDGAAGPAVRIEVGCWSHARRKFWEAAIAKDVVAREALLRIKRAFDADRKLRDRPAAERKALRDLHVRPYVETFLRWAAERYEEVKDQRGSLRSALGYAVRQRDALTRFLEDGRLPMTNNGSERQLRRVAVGRKAWLFVGSDDHGQAAGNLLSLIASARLHGLDPEVYLRDVIRVLPHWPKDRYLELAPRYWADTRSRLDADQLAAHLGPLDVPPPVDTSTEQPASR